MESGSYDGSSRPDVAGEGLLGRSTGGTLETSCEWGGLLVLQWMASGAFADVYLGRVNDPNAVRVFGAGRLGDQIGMWMELVQGAPRRRCSGQDKSQVHPHGHAQWAQ